MNQAQPVYQINASAIRKKFAEQDALAAQVRRLRRWLAVSVAVAAMSLVATLASSWALYHHAEGRTRNLAAGIVDTDARLGVKLHQYVIPIENRITWEAARIDALTDREVARTDEEERKGLRVPRDRTAHPEFPKLRVVAPP